MKSRFNKKQEQSPFSFHCVICIFPFNLDNRNPVVLPCGHTYICEPCSKRLKKCPECRTSLFVKAPTSNTGQCNPTAAHGGWPQNSPSTPISPRHRSTYSTHRERYSHYNVTPNKKPPPVEQIPLPIPKNHVMMALMEAAERKKKALLSDSYESDGDEDCEDSEHVLNGIEAMSSTSGTYVVRDSQGLAVFERNPLELTLKKLPSYLKPPPMVRYGQRVQIVGIENDVYKLARNEGYILADENQLVKVGIPQEKSCKVEGMIRTIRSTKEELINQLKQLENAEGKLKKELKHVMSQPPSHPVIEYINPIEMPELDDQDTFTDGSNADDQLNTDFEMGLSLSEDSHMGSPTPASPPAPCTPSRQVLFLNDESTAISDPLSDSGIRGVRGIRRSESPLMGHFMCGSSFFPILRSASEDEHGDRRQRINLQREDLNESLQRSPDSASIRTDFRTGLSGHIALNSTRRKKLYDAPRHEIRMMGEHRGIASVRRFRRRPTDSPR